MKMPFSLAGQIPTTSHPSWPAFVKEVTNAWTLYSTEQIFGLSRRLLINVFYVVNNTFAKLAVGRM